MIAKTFVTFANEVSAQIAEQLYKQRLQQEKR